MAQPSLNSRVAEQCSIPGSKNIRHFLEDSVLSKAWSGLQLVYMTSHVKEITLRAFGASVRSEK